MLHVSYDFLTQLLWIFLDSGGVRAIHYCSYPTPTLSPFGGIARHETVGLHSLW